jgi:DNA helicase HerA-like ATPase
MAKAARKRAAGLTVITQDAADVLGTELGLAVVSNAATQILMRQSTQSIDAVTAAFHLTPGEARLLLSAPRGEGLLVAGRTRIPFRAQASGTEHTLAVTGIGDTHDHHT